MERCLAQRGCTQSCCVCFNVRICVIYANFPPSLAQHFTQKSSELELKTPFFIFATPYNGRYTCSVNILMRRAVSG